MGDGMTKGRMVGFASGWDFTCLGAKVCDWAVIMVA